MCAEQFWTRQKNIKEQEYGGQTKMKTLPELIIEKYARFDSQSVEFGIDTFIPCSVMMDVLYALKQEQFFYQLKKLAAFNPELVPQMEKIDYQLSCIEKKYNIKKEDYEESKT